MEETWDEIWLRKGRSESTDLRELDGYEKTQVDLDRIAGTIIDVMGLTDGQLILEVGCGAGALAQSLRNRLPAMTYVGTERSATLAAKHIQILGNPVLNFSADDLVFADGLFDCCICFGVFEYFRDFDYARTAVNMFVRQAHSVYIGDITRESHSPHHLLFDDKAAEYILSDLDSATYTWEMSGGLYEPHAKRRFNIAIRRR